MKKIVLDAEEKDILESYERGEWVPVENPNGKGRIILSNSHPNVTGKRADQIRNGMGWEEHARRWGWTDEMVTQGRKKMEESPDPDGPEPDLALAKATLSYAYGKASQ